jgi:hypothetical protein
VLRRAFGGAVPVAFERTAAGVSTLVYRIRRGTGTFYLRLAEEASENLETDAVLYQRLHDLGVKIARVLHVEAFSSEVGRSVMITTETPGRSGVLLGLRQLCRWLSPERGFPLDDPAVTRRVARVRDLLRRV